MRSQGSASADARTTLLNHWRSSLNIIDSGSHVKGSLWDSERGKS
jgi:hypothetical protein